MRALIAAFLVTLLPGLLSAQRRDPKPAEIRGHHIGESTIRLLHLGSDAREEVDLCRQHPTDSLCERLIGAIERGERAEISALTSPGLDDPDAPRDTINFVLDGKKLVKLTMSVKDAADAAKIFGPSSRESALPAGNRAGEKWVNHLTVWEAPDVYATLY